jgi:RING finger protein 113A
VESAAKKAALLGAIESSGTAELHKRDLATAERMIDTSADRDATAEYERRMKEAEDGTGDGSIDLTKRSKEIMGRKKAFGTLGPIRAPTNIRASNVIDYQPDICKDYFETGYCGWGDSCKFLHMREKFTAGWKQELDWKAQEQKREAALASGLRVDADGRILQDQEAPEGAGAAKGAEEGDLPFACFVCRVPFDEKWAQVRSAPVVTQCNHYVCEHCALRRYKKDPTCAVCGKETHGVFNRGSRVIQRMAADGKGPDAPAEQAAATAATAGGGWGSEVVVSK